MTAGRNASAGSLHWGTPRKYVEAVRTFLGGIGLDPCSNPHSAVGADAEFLLPGRDGLREPWDARTVYVNPPYGSDRERGTTIRDWLRRCAEAARAGSEVVALVPVAPNTRHWKLHVWPEASSVCFLADTRVKFLEDGREGVRGAPMACAMVYWGPRAAAFSDAFSAHGAVVHLRAPAPGGAAAA